MTPSRLKQMSDQGSGPRCVNHAKRLPRYRLGDIRAWQDSEFAV
jgi:hypothetical protein